MQDATGDEIDLIEIIQTLWDGKWLITAITAALTILSVGVLLQIPPSFEGSLRITPLSSQEMASYQALNNTPDISEPIYAGEVLIGHKGVVSRQDFFAAFEEKVFQKLIFRAAHMRLDPEINNFDGSRGELAQKLSEIAQNYEYSRTSESEESDGAVVITGELIFHTNDRELASDILELAFAAATENIRLTNLEAIADLKRSIETGLQFESDEVTREIENALSTYEVKTATYLAILKEQAAIARQLGIADYQLGAATQVGIDISIENDTSETPSRYSTLYLRGYKALEQEIALINARGKGDAVYQYIPSYAQLFERKKSLETDRRLERIDRGLALSPLISPEKFKAFNYDLKTVIFKPKINKLLVVIFITLIGSIIAAIFVLIRHSMVQRKQNA